MNFDETEANAICKFAEKYCRLPETGKLIELQDHQRDMLRLTFGRLDDNGNRITRTLYNEIPKKNGKSALASIIALFMLCADNEKSAEVYSVAGSANQAHIIFDTAKKMVAASPALSKIIEPYKHTLIHKTSGSSYRVLASDATNLDGIKPSCILFDELHEQPDRRLWDVLRGGGLSRRQPLTVVTTTAGHSRQSIAWEIHDYATRVRDGKIQDESFLPVIYSAPEDTPLTTEAEVLTAARIANPSLGTTFAESDYLGIWREAVNAGPARLNSWRRYHLNHWTQLETAWLPVNAWNNCGTKRINEAELLGRPCFAAMDLSRTTDLTALVLLFPNEDGSYDVITRHWLPLAKVIEAEQQDKQPYREWAKQGYLNLCNGSAIDYKQVLRESLELFEKFPPVNREIAMDDYNAWQFMDSLREEGYEPVGISQKTKGLSAPTKELLNVILNSKLNHGSNPLLTFQASVVEVKEDSDGNIKPVKGAGDTRKRIDGIVCLIMAMGRAMVVGRQELKSMPSVYESRGVIII